MPNVIADTSCLIVLDKIDGLFILEEMYRSVLVTPTVKAEYGKELPAFVRVRTVGNPNYETLLRAIVILLSNYVCRAVVRPTSVV